MKKIKCNHCKTIIGADPKNATLWHGFYDQDTEQHVCLNCKPLHYQKKFSQQQFRGLYSEFLVVIN